MIIRSGERLQLPLASSARFYPRARPPDAFARVVFLDMVSLWLGSVPPFSRGAPPAKAAQVAPLALSHLGHEQGVAEAVRDVRQPERPPRGERRPLERRALKGPWPMWVFP